MLVEYRCAYDIVQAINPPRSSHTVALLGPNLPLLWAEVVEAIVTIAEDEVLSSSFSRREVKFKNGAVLRLFSTRNVYYQTHMKGQRFDDVFCYNLTEEQVQEILPRIDSCLTRSACVLRGYQ